MILTKLHACLRMKIQSIKLYHRKEHPNHHKVLKSFQQCSSDSKVSKKRQSFAEIWKSESASPQALDSRCLSSCCLASWQQMLLRHPIDTSSLAQRRILRYPTGYNGMQESLRLHRIAQNASVHSWPLSLSVALLPLSCASPFLPLPARESSIAKGKSVQGHG